MGKLSHLPGLASLETSPAVLGKAAQYQPSPSTADEAHENDTVGSESTQASPGQPLFDLTGAGWLAGAAGRLADLTTPRSTRMLEPVRAPASTL